LNDVYAFAEPLLKHALRDYGTVDVRNTYLRLYVEANLAWWKINISGAQTSKTVSLLDAALGNFAASDDFLDFAFLGPSDARGQRDVLSITHRTSAPASRRRGSKTFAASWISARSINSSSVRPSASITRRWPARFTTRWSHATKPR